MAVVAEGSSFAVSAQHFAVADLSSQSTSIKSRTLPINTQKLRVLNLARKGQRDSMQVLHLTDLHFQHEQPFQKRLIKALLDDIGQNVADSLSPDIIVFSGDLVQNPDDPDVFKYFAEHLFFPLLSAARLSSKEVVFCPGNHDVSFRAVDEWKDERANLQKHAASFDSLDSYLKTGPAKAYVRAISAGFYDFLNSIDQSWDDQPLNHVYKFPQKLSFVSISTAFACGREGSVYDRGKLALPIELRQFKFDPVEMVLADRGAYIAAALTVCRAYIVAGRPNKAPRLASFEGWSDTVRSALIWLDVADPVLSMESARAEDPERLEISDMMEAWGRVIGIGGGARVRTADAILKGMAMSRSSDGESLEPDHPDFYAALEALAFKATGKRNQKPDAAMLGLWLRRFKGRVIGNKRFANMANEKRGAEWWVEEV